MADRRAYLYKMSEKSRLVVPNDDQWAVCGPLIDECRPRDNTDLVSLRETSEAIIWRRQNGTKCSMLPLTVTLHDLYPGNRGKIEADGMDGLILLPMEHFPPVRSTCDRVRCR